MVNRLCLSVQDKLAPFLKKNNTEMWNLKNKDLSKLMNTVETKKTTDHSPFKTTHEKNSKYSLKNVHKQKNMIKEEKGPDFVYKESEGNHHVEKINESRFEDNSSTDSEMDKSREGLPHNILEKGKNSDEEEEKTVENKDQRGESPSFNMPELELSDQNYYDEEKLDVKKISMNRFSSRHTEYFHEDEFGGGGDEKKSEEGNQFSLRESIDIKKYQKTHNTSSDEEEEKEEDHTEATEVDTSVNSKQVVLFLKELKQMNF